MLPGNLDGGGTPRFDVFALGVEKDDNDGHSDCNDEQQAAKAEQWKASPTANVPRSSFLCFLVGKVTIGRRVLCKSAVFRIRSN